MHARVVIYKLKRGTTNAVLQRAQTGLLPIFLRQPGYRAYHIVRAPDDTVISYSTWDSEAHCRDAIKAAKEWVDENIAPQVESAVLYLGPVVDLTASSTTS